MQTPRATTDRASGVDPKPAAAVTLVTVDRANEIGWSSARAAVAGGSQLACVGPPYPDAAGNPLVHEVEAMLMGPPGPLLPLPTHPAREHALLSSQLLVSCGRPSANTAARVAPIGPYCHPHRVRLTFRDGWPGENTATINVLSIIHHFQLAHRTNEVGLPPRHSRLAGLISTDIFSVPPSPLAAADGHLQRLCRS